MQLGTLLSDDDAVSPVIGVFVLGASSTASVPDAQLRYVAEEGATDGWGNSGDGVERFVIEHDGGGDIELDRVEVQYTGTDVSSAALSWLDSDPPGGDDWRPGETWELTDPDPGSGGDFARNEQVLVLWTAPDGSGSQILANGDLP